MSSKGFSGFIFKKLTGQWDGYCRTWFEPEKLADESPIHGEITSILDGRFLRHVYTGRIEGKLRRGEELIAFNSVTKHFQVSWVDDFHMSDAILFSQGKTTDVGFSVFGQYDVAANEPKWGWRTNFSLYDENRLIITAFNVSPEGSEAKAVETTYTRR